MLQMSCCNARIIGRLLRSLFFLLFWSCQRKMHRNVRIRQARDPHCSSTDLHIFCRQRVSVWLRNGSHGIALLKIVNQKG